MEQNNPNIYPQQYPPMYGQNYCPPPPPPPKIISVPVQSNGIPVTPFPDEKKWIKHFYNWTGGMLLIHLGISTLIITTISFIAGFLFFSKSSSSFELLTTVGTVAGYMTANLFVFFVGCKVTKVKIKPFFKFGKLSGKFLLGSIIIALAIQATAIIVQTVGINLIQLTTNVDLYDLINKILDDSSNSFAAEIIMVFYACIGAPITEELVFRGFCLKNLSRFNQRFGIIASALLFALLHGNILQFILAFPLGILLAYVAIKANSIIPCIIIHFTVNTTATILDKISELNETLGNYVQLIWFASVFVAGIVLLVIALAKYKTRLPKKALPKSKRGWPLFLSTAPTIIFTAFYSIIIIIPLALIPFLDKLAPLIYEYLE